MSNDLTGPSDMERRLVTALEHLYLAQVTEEDFQDAAEVTEPDDFENVTYENLIPSVKVMKALHGRYLALKFLWWKFQTEAEFYDPWFYRFFIESLELDILEDVGEEYPAKLESLAESTPGFINLVENIPRLDYAVNQYVILRGCATIEQYLTETVATEQYREVLSNGRKEEVTLAKVTNWAVKDSVLTPLERQVVHFIREVRNQAAHSMWLDRNYSLDTLELARECVHTLMAVFLQKCTQNHTGLYTEEMDANLSEKEEELSELQSRIEEELEWFYFELEHRWIIEENSDEPSQ